MLKYIKERDFQAIIAGKKTAIAKLNIGFWKDVEIGTTIIFTDGKNETNVKVNGKKYFSSIGEAWFSYKTVCETHPVFPELDNSTAVSISDVNRLYEYDFPTVIVNETGIVVVDFIMQ